jgi:hypothetical protein
MLINRGDNDFSVLCTGMLTLTCFTGSKLHMCTGSNYSLQHKVHFPQAEGLGLAHRTLAKDDYLHNG